MIHLSQKVECWTSCYEAIRCEPKEERGVVGRHYYFHCDRHVEHTTRDVSRQTHFFPKNHRGKRGSIRLPSGHFHFLDEKVYLQPHSTKVNKMKFSLPAVIAATCAAPAFAEIFMKEQFNDDVSEKILPSHYQRSWWSSFSQDRKMPSFA